MQQNIEFERCIDFLVRMIDKYGEEVLRELEEKKQNKEEKTAQNTSFHSICKTVEVSFSQVRLAILHRKQSLSFFRLTRNHFMPRIDSYKQNTYERISYFYSQYKRFQSLLPMHQVTNIYVLSSQISPAFFYYDSVFSFIYKEMRNTSGYSEMVPLFVMRFFVQPALRFLLRSGL